MTKHIATPYSSFISTICSAFYALKFRSLMKGAPRTALESEKGPRDPLELLTSSSYQVLTMYHSPIPCNYGLENIWSDGTAEFVRVTIYTDGKYCNLLTFQVQRRRRRWSHRSSDRGTSSDQLEILLGAVLLLTCQNDILAIVVRTMSVVISSMPIIRSGATRCK